MWLVTAPGPIIYKFQGKYFKHFLTVLLVWRLFTGLLMHGDLMTLLFAVLSYLPTAMEVERKIGTVPMIWRFWTLGLISNLLFITVCGITGIQQIGMGLWPLLFVDLVIQCMEAPDNAMNLCCLPIQIPAKYYPPVLLLIFTLFMGGPQICLFAGLIVGYIYHYGFLNRIKLSNARATAWEAKGCLKSIAEKESFIKTGALGPTMAGEIINPGNGPAPEEETKSAGFKAFAGKGKSIGGGGPSQPA